MTHSSSSSALRLGTRGSMLARTQSQWVANQLQARHPGLTVQLQIIKTSGDQIADRPLHEAGGKGLFVKELERALLDGQVDIAVHSFKDVPVTMPLVEQERLMVGAVPPREDASDCLVSLIARNLLDLPQGAKVATGSLRRAAQLLSLRPDFQVQPVRGNIDTRLRHLTERQFDAVILAMAGLNRASLVDPAKMHAIPFDQMLPAAGQGALSIQCRRDDARAIQIVSVMHDQPTALCVSLERKVVELLGGDCVSPIAAHAHIEGTTVHLSAVVGRRGGHPPLLKARGQAELAKADGLAEQVFAELEKQGARAHLHG